MRVRLGLYSLFSFTDDRLLSVRKPVVDMFAVRGSQITGQLWCIREITRLQIHTTLTKCRGCHITRLQESHVQQGSRVARRIKHNLFTAIFSWSRTASSSSKNGKKDVSAKPRKETQASSAEDGPTRPSAETEKMIRSIAETLKAKKPAEPLEELNKLNGVMSELDKLQLGKSNSAMKQKMTDTKQKLEDLNINAKVEKDIRKKQVETYNKYLANNYLDLHRAKEEYLLTDIDLKGIPKLQRRNPYSSTLSSHENIDVVMLTDVLKVVDKKFGSMENLEKERKKRAAWSDRTTGIFFSASAIDSSKTFIEKLKEVLNTLKTAFYQDDSGKVVAIALAINLANAIMKFILWMLTGSPSMFSEFMHSTGDTLNQLMLAIGKYLSMQKPDSEHPYGYINHIHIMSIVSGVGIFCFGFGLTFYNGIIGLLNPTAIAYDDLFGALKVLSGSLVSELATLFTAFMKIRHESQKQNIPFWKYVKDGEDPLVNVVLLEDLSAVIGVLVCAGAMSLGVYTGMPRYDAVGSLIISLMMGSVSYFIVHTNADVLLGRSLSYQRDIIKTIEQDRCVRAVMDSKGTDYGMYSRYKAELHLDGRQIALDYMDTTDMDEFIKKLNEANDDEKSELLTQFGEGCVDRVSVQIDRIEAVLKKKYPELRHIDLEV